MRRIVLQLFTALMAVCNLSVVSSVFVPVAIIAVLSRIVVLTVLSHMGIHTEWIRGNYLEVPQKRFSLINSLSSHKPI